MLLSEIYKNTGIIINKDINIKSIEIDSRKVKKGDLFIAIKGFETDGHYYINDAIKRGASSILIDEDRYNDFNDIDIINTCKNTSDILGIICSNYYKNPSKKFKLIGITGTKGKTTTSFIIKNILEEANYKVGLIGTLGSYINKNKIFDNDRTTPDSLALQKIFSKMAKEKCDFVVMEVSSQSLKLNRVIGSNFDLTIFTNFSEDHISKKEHCNLNDYFLSKAKLFDMSKTSIINLDDDKSKELIRLKNKTKYITYGINNESDKMAHKIKINKNGTSFITKIYNKNKKIFIHIPGIFSVYNSLCAITICEYFKVDTKSIINGLKKVKVKGRNELINNKLELNIIIDYAHTEKSMENIIRSTNEYKKGRIITVFGCGGDRDKNKRKKMGKISGELSDYTIITSDNPRTENPLTIIKEIESGIIPVTNNYEIIENRIEAIKKAIIIADKNDIILLLGKGHEDYQEVNNTKYPFDERKIIEKIIDELI